MKKLLLPVFVISGLLLVNPALTLACPPQQKQCMNKESKKQTNKIEKLKKKAKLLWMNKETLGLEEEQLDKIKNIKHAAMKEIIQLTADKDIVIVDLTSEMWEKSIDVDTVDKLIDIKYEAKKKIAKTYVKAIGDIQQVLSDEQKEQWFEMLVQEELSKSKGCSGMTDMIKTCPMSGKKLPMMME